MSFILSGNITVGPFKPFKFSWAEWDRHIDNYADTATFCIPAFGRLISKSVNGYNNQIVPIGLQLNEGMPVTIEAGYDDNDDVQFKGFIKRINFKVPLEVECEGYSYLLRKVIFTKAYRRTTVKQVLTDLIALVPGMPITLHPATQDVVFEGFPFNKYTGVQVLDFLKEKYLLTVCFFFNQLYAGLREPVWNNAKSETVKHLLGWNTIKDDRLLFNADKEFATVNVQLESLNSDGTRNKALSKLLTPGNIKRIKTLLKDSYWLKQAAQEQKIKLNNRGYSGELTTFLKPYVAPGMADDMTDNTYPERKGLHFIEGVKGSLSRSGGRQIVKIGNSL